jgi:hypothetical protein
LGFGSLYKFDESGGIPLKIYSRIPYSIRILGFCKDLNNFKKRGMDKNAIDLVFKSID